jgi:hypothetical protein
MKPKATMGAWKVRKLEKGRRASQDTGKSKGIVASPLQRYMCRANRSWKHAQYAFVMGSGEFPRKGTKKG